MTWSAVLLVTAVVWAVSLIRSVRLRAFVYSLPLPMTLALVTTGYRVDGAQLLGVLGLNLFFVTVALTHHRLRWPIVLADVAGVAAYVALSAGLLAVPLPFEPALAGTVALWLLAMLVLRRHPRVGAPAAGVPAEHDPPTPPAPDKTRSPDQPPGADRSTPAAAGQRDPLPTLVKLVVIFLGAVLTGLLGQLLRGMVVTFPYSGVLVAIETRRTLVEFSRHFARNSLALVGFLTGYHYCQDLSPVAGLAAGWAAFALLAVALHLPWRRVVPGSPGRHPAPVTNRSIPASGPE